VAIGTIIITGLVGGIIEIKDYWKHSATEVTESTEKMEKTRV